MVLYEFPFNESMRTMLRLEHLFDRLGQLLPRDAVVDHHFALVTLFELVDVAARADLKSDLLRELDRQRTQLNAYRGNAQVEQRALDQLVGRLDSALAQLGQQQGKAGQALASNDWLTSVRSRINIPGGTCEFDLPAYYAWQQHDAARRRADLSGWIASMAPTAQAVQLLLQLVRESGTPHKVASQGGQFQQSLPPGRAYSLVRLRMAPDCPLVPEISGHRLMVSVRLMSPEADGRLRPASQDAAFELTLCH